MLRGSVNPLPPDTNAERQLESKSPLLPPQKLYANTPHVWRQKLTCDLKSHSGTSVT